MSPTEVRRVVVVVLDGLRPDAVDAFDLENLRALARTGAFTPCARTVSPSLTWPALTSLMSGVAPDVHGILSDSVQLPRPKSKLVPLPDVLHRSGYPSVAFMGAIPVLYRGVATRIAKGLGFAEARFAGGSAPEVLSAGRSALRTQRRGMIFFHWADADRVGHEHGWMSSQYGDAARRLDETLGQLRRAANIANDGRTLLIAVADHGGGGVVATDHAHDHPLNRTIPMVLAGGAVHAGPLADATLLDVPATIAWALGVPQPRTWSGRVLHEAFDTASEAAVA